jgi:hypothetical protein
VATIERKQVWSDGGAGEGILIYSQDALAAVFSRIKPDEAGDRYEAGHWFMEAGFGDCGILKQSQAVTFASIDEATAWVDKQMLD